MKYKILLLLITDIMLAGCLPVMMLARVGEQSGLAAYARVKLMQIFANRVKLGGS